MLSESNISRAVLLLVVALIPLTMYVPVSASFCQISNVSYSYPQQVTSGQSVLITTKVSGICASDDSYFYSVRVDASDVYGQVISTAVAAIGYGGQNRQVIVQNLVTAPMNIGPWQIQIFVYVFANIASGGTMDYKSAQIVTIRVGTV